MALSAAALVYDPFAPAAAGKRTLLLVLALALLARSAARLLAKASTSLALSPALLTLSAWLLFSGLSLSWSANPGYLTFSVYVAAFGLMVDLQGGQIDVQVIRNNTALFVGTGASLWCIGSFIFGARGFELHAGQGNPDWLGLLLALTLPLSLNHLATLPGRLLRTLVALSSGLQVGALFLAHSRVAWLAALVAFGVLAFRLAPRTQRAAFAFMLLALAGAALTTALDANLTFSSDNPAAESFEGRVWIAETTLSAAKTALPLGTGLGGFGGAYLDAQGTRLAALSPDLAASTFVNVTTAHGDFVEVLCETGPLGLLLLLSALALALRAAWQSGDSGRLACLVSAMVTMLGDSPLHQPACALLLLLCLPDAPRSLTLSRTTSRVGVLVLLAWAALLLRESASDWWAEHLVARAQDAPPEQQLGTFAKASRLAPRNGQVAFGLGEARLEAGDPEGALEALRRSEALLPSVATQVALGNTLVTLGRLPEAQAAYEKAVRRNPGSLRAQTNLAALLLDVGQLDEAEKHLRIARDLSPGHAKVRALEDALAKARIDRAAAGAAD